jgi:hypothetical protein
MFKKNVLMFLLMIFPLIFVFFAGYPIGNEKARAAGTGGHTYSRRCFRVGEWQETVDCYRRGKAVRGADLVLHLNKNIGSVYPQFNLIFFLSLIIFQVLSLIILL